jgi:hypothetical protein
VSRKVISTTLTCDHQVSAAVDISLCNKERIAYAHSEKTCQSLCDEEKNFEQGCFRNALLCGCQKADSSAAKLFIMQNQMISSF